MTSGHSVLKSDRWSLCHISFESSKLAQSVSMIHSAKCLQVIANEPTRQNGLWQSYNDFSNFYWLLRWLNNSYVLLYSIKHPLSNDIWQSDQRRTEWPLVISVDQTKPRAPRSVCTKFGPYTTQSGSDNQFSNRELTFGTPCTAAW